MALRGKAPEKQGKRLKCLFFGGAGAGKTTAAIGFPRPYVLDLEKGAENDQYVDAINAAGGAVYRSNDWDDIVAEVRALLTEEHPYRTLVIDPITTIFDDAVDRAEDEVGQEWGRHRAQANRDWKRLGRLLGRLDMNLIVTAHGKSEVDQKTKRVVGMTYDGPKGLDHLFDLVLRVERAGRGRVGVVTKTRLAGFPDGEQIPFGYDEIARRYGREQIERDAVCVRIASEADLRELDRLLRIRADREALVAKWLKAAGADSLELMPADAVAKCIGMLRAQIHTSAE